MLRNSSPTLLTLNWAITQVRVMNTGLKITDQKGEAIVVISTFQSNIQAIGKYPRKTSL